MAKKNKVEKNKGERERLRLKKEIERAEALLEQDALLENEMPLEDSNSPVGDETVSEQSAPSAAAAWKEYESEMETVHKEDAVREATYTIQDLVINILHSEKSLDEKVQKVGDGLGEPIQTKKEISDMDVLDAEALLARDSRNLSLVEKAKDAIARLTGASDGPAHIRYALSIAVKALKAGDESARPTVVDLRAQAKSAGIGGMDRTRSSVIVEKDAKGGWRAVMWPSNNFKDWDGDIISESAHIEFVDWVNKNMDVAPIFLSWHTPETVRKNRVDFVSYENGFLLMSAPLEQDEAAALLKAQTLTDLGMSHGSFAVRDPQDTRVIVKYRMFEVSDLPLDKAANPFTDIETLTKEASMDQKKYLATILGSDEAADAYMQKAGMKQQALRKAGVEEKEKSDSNTQTEQVAVGDPKPTDTLTLDAVLEAVSKELDIPGLNAFLLKAKEDMDKVEVLEGLVKSLSTGHDEKVADMISGRKPADFVWKSRPTVKEDNILKDDEPLKKAVPGVSDDYWLSQVSGTEPVAATNS